MNKWVKVFTGLKSDSKWPENAVEFVDWLQGHIDTVPEIYRGNVSIDIDLNGFFEPDDVELCILYSRPETGDEAKARTIREHVASKAREDHERNMLKTLLGKYGNGE